MVITSILLYSSRVYMYQKFSIFILFRYKNFCNITTATVWCTSNIRTRRTHFCL